MRELWASRQSNLSLTPVLLFGKSVYPSKEFVHSFDNDTPEIFAIVVAAAFLVVGSIFVLYDVFVQRRNRKVIANAARSNAIVTQLFPGKIRDQVLADQDETQQLAKGSTRTHIKSFVSGKNDAATLMEGSKPLAELFLETSVLMGDVCLSTGGYKDGCVSSFCVAHLYSRSFSFYRLWALLRGPVSIQPHLI